MLADEIRTIRREADMAVVVERSAAEKHERRRDTAYLLHGAALLIIAVVLLLYVLWKILASTQATPFDADGVRCYKAADQMICIKTANP
jgi:type VI protein secretion system component VasF